MSVGQLFLTRKSDLPYRLFQSSSSSSRCDAGRRVRPKQPTHAHRQKTQTCPLSPTFSSASGAREGQGTASATR